MRLRPGRPRVALVVAPHPDDETIGAFGLMVHLRRLGTCVRVAIVTDGARSHGASPGWPRARLVAERERESRRVLRTIGIGAGAVTFLRLPDGALAADRAQHDKVAREVRRTRALGLLIGPTGDDDHPDHRAVAAMLGSVRGPTARRLAYRVWPGRSARRDRPLATFPLGRLRAAKYRAVRSYRTQAGLITDDPTGFAMSRAEIARFAGPVERFFEARR